MTVNKSYAIMVAVDGKCVRCVVNKIHFMTVNDLSVEWQQKMRLKKDLLIELLRPSSSLSLLSPSNVM